MKKTIGKILLACLLCVLITAGSAAAEQLAFGGLSFEENAVSIDLGDLQVKDWDGFVAFLEQFPCLEKVDMFATLTRKAEADRLAETFPDIRFGWTLDIARGAHTVRTDAEAFSTLHGWCDMHRSGDLEVLKYCTEMKALDLGHNHLTDLSFLACMPHLRVLILAGNKYIGDNAAALACLKELEYLELFGCGVRDVSFLAELPNLTDLNISNNKVVDWTPLKQLKQLKRLWVSNLWGIRMPKADQEALREALPDTRIEFKGDPTANGWREDPHYDVIYEIFHTGRYIPFAESAPLPGSTEDE